MFTWVHLVALVLTIKLPNYPTLMRPFGAAAKLSNFEGEGEVVGGAGGVVDGAGV